MNSLEPLQDWQSTMSPNMLENWWAWM
jgi:hypothetical protein